MLSADLRSCCLWPASFLRSETLEQERHHISVKEGSPSLFPDTEELHLQLHCAHPVLPYLLVFGCLRSLHFHPCQTTQLLL